MLFRSTRLPNCLENGCDWHNIKLHKKLRKSLEMCFSSGQLVPEESPRVIMIDIIDLLYR